MHPLYFSLVYLCERFAGEVVAVEEVGQHFLVERVGAPEVLAHSALGEGVAWQSARTHTHADMQKCNDYT